MVVALRHDKHPSHPVFQNIAFRNNRHNHLCALFADNNSRRVKSDLFVSHLFFRVFFVPLLAPIYTRVNVATQWACFLSARQKSTYHEIYC